ncbi:hypothetical protein FNF31_00420 [Cafeteria roenbergensis]|uniref:IPT/TIG domain-containing protein n=1 Tax=Cafeteria roenbergensis TaxID=33653 RepID=A0A5A8E0A0_CAFRO|nr:hypothetical protein FNF31_00420 [Cafeteria roenbergensis]KAA0171175.1 hypothetical protein FNF28_00941 [Cafeteria roenbergensis]
MRLSSRVGGRFCAPTLLFLVAFRLAAAVSVEEASLTGTIGTYTTQLNAYSMLLAGNKGKAVAAMDIDGDGHPELLLGFPLSAPGSPAVAALTIDDTATIEDAVSAVDNMLGTNAGAALAPMPGFLVFSAAQDAWLPVLLFAAPGPGAPVAAEGRICVAVMDPGTKQALSSDCFDPSNELVPAGSKFHNGGSTALAYLGDIDGDGRSGEFAFAGTCSGATGGCVFVGWLNAEAELERIETVHLGKGALTEGAMFGTPVSFGLGLNLVRRRNGDGITVLAVGDPDMTVGGVSYGAILLLRLDSGANVVSASAITPGSLWEPGQDLQFNSGFGAAVATTGFFEDSSQATMWVGAPRYSLFNTEEGALVYIVIDNPESESPSVSKSRLLSASSLFSSGISAQAGGRLGTSLFAAGDVAGDGSPSELLIGAPGTSITGTVFVSTFARSLQAQFLVAEAVLSDSSWEQSGAPRLQLGINPAPATLNPAGGGGGQALALRVPESVALNLTTSEIHINGKPCVSTIAAPATWWNGRGVLCRDPPTGTTDLAVTIKLVVDGTTARVTGGAHFATFSQSTAETRVHSTVTPGGGGALGSSEVPEGAGLGTSAAFLGDMLQTGTPNSVAVGMPLTQDGGRVVIASLVRYNLPEYSVGNDDISDDVLGLETEAFAAAWERGVSGTGQVQQYSVLKSDTTGMPLGLVSAGDAFGASITRVAEPTLGLSPTSLSATLAVGAPGDDTSAANAGCVHLIAVARPALAVLATAKIAGGSGAVGALAGIGSGARFGSAMAAGVTAGRERLVVGADGHLSGAGAVFVLTVDALGSVETAQMLAPTAAQAGEFGAAVALTDVNGDGAADVIVGSPGCQSGIGCVTVILSAGAAFGGGSNFTATPLMAGIAPNVAESMSGGFGTAVSAFDLDGDGLMEVFVGSAPESSAAKSAEVNVLWLSATGSVRAASTLTGTKFQLPSSSHDMAFGASLAWLADLNDGGHAAELLIGDPGLYNDLGQEAGGFVVLSAGAFPDQTQPTFSSTDMVLHSADSGAGGIPQSGGTLVISGENMTFPLGAAVSFHAKLGGVPCDAVWVTADGKTLVCEANPGYGVLPITVDADELLIPTSGAPLYAHYAAPVLTSIGSVLPVSSLPQSGSLTESLVISGSNLVSSNLGTSSGLSLMIGTTPCPSVVRSSAGTLITCSVIPPGYGGPLEVRLLLPGGQTSNALYVSYAPAVLTGISPSTFSPTAQGFGSASIFGTGLGPDANVSQTLTLAGNPCLDLVWHSSTHIECRNFSLQGFSGHDVELSQGGSLAQGGADLFSYVPAPLVVGAIPVVVPSAGGTNITFFASGLGQGTIAKIELGSTPCLAWGLVDAFQGWCTTPPGSGKGVYITVTTESQLKRASLRPLLDYAAPTVGAIDPSLASSNPERKYTFRITGTNFGPGSASLGQVRVGGVDCAPAEYVSDTEITCHNVSAPWASSTVSVAIDGQTGTSSTAFAFLPPTLVTAVSPSVGPTGGGTNLRIEGQGFGNLTAVFVGGVQCQSFSRESSFIAHCVSPPGTGAGKAVRVETATNGPAESVAFSYAKPALSDLARSWPVGAAAEAQTFAGEAAIDVTVKAVNMGTNASAISRAGLRAGAWEVTCGALAVTHRNSSNQQIEGLRCTGLNLTAAPAAGVVQVVAFAEVSGQGGISSNALPVLGRPQVATIVPSMMLPTLGGNNITIFGSLFGAHATDLTAVRVGDALAKVVAHVSDTELIVRVPPGIGVNVPVTVQTRGGLQSMSIGAKVSYAPPEIDFVEPDYLIAGSTEQVLVITVMDAGQDPNAPIEASVDNVACMTVFLDVHASAIECLLADTFPFGVVSKTLVVAVSVAGQRSQPMNIELIGQPSVLLVNPSTAPTQGMGSALAAPVIVVGTNFGRQASDVVSVTVGGVPSPRVEWFSDTKLHIAVAPGTGSSAPVVVTTRGGLSNAPLPLFGYAAAEVTSISPSYAVEGNQSLDFVVTGSNFGNSQADVSGITVGEQPCARALWVSPTTVRCIGVNASSFSSSSVTVTVGGVEGLRNSFLERVPAPAIRTVSPKVAEVGATVLILGSGFGYARSDIKEVSVAREPCTAVSHEGPTAVICTMPPVAQWLRASATEDPSLLGNLDVVVTTRGGLRSEAGKVSYAGAGVPLAVAPSFVRGWREVDQTGTIEATWAFPDDNPNDATAAVTGFSFEMAKVGSTMDSTGAIASSIANNVLLAGLRDAPKTTADGMVLYSHTLAAIQVKPVLIRVRAENPTGPGPWSNWTEPIPANCRESQYLTTQLDSSEWVCADCPAGAYCGGTKALSLTGRRGYWRVPWSPAGIGFRKCPQESACRGFDPSDARTPSVGNVTASQARRRSLQSGVQQRTLDELLGQLSPPTAVPHSSLGNKSSDEGCETGYTGILCAECADGYARQGQHKCGACADTVLVLVGFVAAAVVVCIVIGVLIFGALQTGRALQQGGQPKSTMPAVKIVMSHMQTIAIAATLTLRWPASVSGLFGALAVASSVSTDVLRLECVFPQLREQFGSTLASSFFARAAVMLALPIILILLSLAFWVVVAPLVRPCMMSCWCGRLLYGVRGRTPDPETGVAGEASPKPAGPSHGAIAAATTADPEHGSSPSDGHAGSGKWTAAAPQARGLDSDARSKAPGQPRRSWGASWAEFDASVVSGPQQRSAQASLSRRVNATSHHSDTSAISRARGMAEPDDARKARASLVPDLPTGTVEGLGSAAKRAGSVASAWSHDAPATGRPSAGRRSTDSKHAAGESRPVAEADPARPAPLSKGQDLEPAADPAATSVARHLHLTIRDKLVIAAIIVCFTMHMSVTQMSLSLMTCSTVTYQGELPPGTSTSSSQVQDTSCAGHDPSRRLSAELGICCNNPRSQIFMFGMGVPGVIVYAFGIPLSAAAVLFWRRNQLDSDDRTRAVLGFLYLGFKPKAFFWESITMVRKALVATIAVLLAPTGSANQTYASLLVVFLLTVAHLIVQPYQAAELNRLELLALVAAFLTFECGLYLTDPGVADAMAELATVAIFAINIAFLCLALFTITRSAADDFGITKRLASVAPKGEEDDEEEEPATSGDEQAGSPRAAASGKRAIEDADAGPA